MNYNEQIIKERIAELNFEIKKLEDRLNKFEHDMSTRKRIQGDIKLLSDLLDVSQNMYYTMRGLQ